MYKNFAYIYDKLMYDINYSAWADYIESIFQNNKLKPELVLDLGCGTGNLCIELAERGYDMIGVDISVDMLECARTKAEKKGVNVLYLNQDMTNFELYGTVDAIVCLMDSINYITHKNGLKRLFKLVNNYLNPGGLFIFDINSSYKLEKVLGNNVFYEIGEDVTYIWQNSYDKKKKICEFELTFFVKEQDYFKKHEEVHYERAYSEKELSEMINEFGMSIVGSYHDLTLSPAKKTSERIFFVCKK